MPNLATPMGRALLGHLGGAGNPFVLGDYLAALSDGVFFDFTKTDRFFQEVTGLTLADDNGELVGQALDSRTWAARTLAQQVATKPEKVVNGGFDADTVWSKGVGWMISGGVAFHTGATTNLSQNIGLTAGLAYQSTFDISAISGALSVYCGIAATPGTTSLTGAQRFNLTAAGDATLYFQCTTATVDNSSIRELGRVGLQGTGAQKPARQSAGAKFDGSDDNLLTTYFAGAAANFIGARTTVPASLGTTQAVIGASGSGTARAFLAIDTSGRACAGVGSNSTTTIVGTTDLRGLQADVYLTWDGTTVRLIVNGVVEYEAAQNGAVTTSIAMCVGASNVNGSPGSFYAGFIKVALAGRDFITAARANQISSGLAA